MKQSAAPARLNIGTNIFEQLGPARGGHNIRAVLRKPQCNRAAQTRTAAEHDGDTARKIETIPGHYASSAL
jgi:hypothetical protein